MVGIDPVEHIHEMLDAERERTAALLLYLERLDGILRLAVRYIEEVEPESETLKIIKAKLEALEDE